MSMVTSHDSMTMLGEPRRRRVRGALAFVTAVVFGVVGALVPMAAHAAPGDPFNPANPTVYIGQSATAAQGTELLRAEAGGDGAFSFTQVGSAAAGRYNAMGWNPADGYIYAMTSNAIGAIPMGALIRIGQNNVITRVGTQTYTVPDPLPGRGGAVFFAGAFNAADGLFYVGDGFPSIAINASTGAVAKRLPTNPNITAPDFVELGGYFWMLTSSGDMARVNPANGSTTVFPSPVPGGQGFGAAWQFGNGNLGFSGNTTGTVYQIAITNPGAASPGIHLVSSVPGPPAAFNDGTSVPGLPSDLEIVKTAPEAFVPGDLLSYQLTVTNHGAGDSSGWLVEDSLPAGLSVASINSTANCAVDGQDVACTGGRLLAGESATVEINVQTSAAMTTCVTNTAMVTGNEEDKISANNSSTATSCPSIIAVVKAADPSDPASFNVGQLITYVFEVTNTGQTTLSNVTVDETAFSGSGSLSALSPASVASLAPGASATFTASYTLTQIDVDAGSVTNSATATGVPPSGGTPTSPPSTVKIPVIPAPALELVKTADLAEITAAGQEVNYSFVVTNTGNVTVSGVTVDETAFGGSGPMSALAPASVASLLPGASATFTSTYVVTQADVDAGDLANTAVAVGTTPGGGDPTSPPSNVTVPVTPVPALELLKSATPSDPASFVAGQEIAYSFVATNTGNVTLTNVTVNESAFTGSGALSPLSPASVAALAPGASATFTATYTLTQADVDAGSVTNTAIATGVPPSGATPTSPPSTVEIPVIPAPALALSKTADLTEIVAAGEEVTYSFLVTNTGNVTITNVRVDETAFSGSGTMSPLSPASVASLLPGASTTFTAAYVVTQADVDSSQLSNMAVAIGTSPGGTPTSPPSSVVVPVLPAPALDVVKSASPSDAASFVAGQEIEYSFVVTNTGNLTLTDVAVDETAFTGTGARSPIVPAAAPQLAPGDSVTFRMLYTLTQADVDSGSVTNTATATGVPPHGGTPTSPPSTVTIPVDPAPALSLVKSADVTELVAAGQEITYSFLATNIGNVTITNVTIDETAFSGSGALSALSPASAALLLPGEAATFTATYVATQEDVDSGAVTNTATATGDSPGGGTPVSPPSTVTTPTAPAPSLALVKTVDRTSVVGVDQLVTYTFSVKNTGNLTLSDVRIDESVFSGTGELSAVTCAAGGDILAPGESTECTASYRTTAADVAAGRLNNEALASGIPLIQSPGDRITSPPSSVRVTITAPPGGLATTGADVASTLLPALSLLIGGAGVMLLARRMRTPLTIER